MKFGIVGYGRFGKLWAEALHAFGEVLVYDETTHIGVSDQKVKITSLQAVAQADIVFLLMPISAIPVLCKQIKPYLGNETLVVDGCSVKTYPVQVMQSIFSPAQPLMATHPLFGPDSVKQNGGLKDLKMVVCSLNCDKKYQTRLFTLLNALSLKVLLTTPEDHDKQMATSQALVHFIGRGLAPLELMPQLLATPDFQALLHINSMVMNDSMELFLDMHRYNPYTKTMRKNVIAQLLKLDELIKMETLDDNH